MALPRYERRRDTPPVYSGDILAPLVQAKQFRLEQTMKDRDRSLAREDQEWLMGLQQRFKQQTPDYRMQEQKLSDYPEDRALERAGTQALIDQRNMPEQRNIDPRSPAGIAADIELWNKTQGTLPRGNREPTATDLKYRIGTDLDVRRSQAAFDDAKNRFGFWDNTAQRVLTDPLAAMQMEPSAQFPQGVSPLDSTYKYQGLMNQGQQALLAAEANAYNRATGNLPQPAAPQPQPVPTQEPTQSIRGYFEQLKAQGKIPPVITFESLSAKELQTLNESYNRR